MSLNLAQVLISGISCVDIIKIFPDSGFCKNIFLGKSSYKQFVTGHLKKNHR